MISLAVKTTSAKGKSVPCLQSAVESCTRIAVSVGRYVPNSSRTALGVRTDLALHSDSSEGGGLFWAQGMKERESIA